MSSFLAIALVALVAAPAADPVVAVVGATEVRVSAVRAQLGAAERTPEAVERAVAEAIAVAALAAEAHARLGDAARGRSDVDAAALLSARLFDPAQRCAQLPEPDRRQGYAEARWRFHAPPAFVVDDLQVLCCTSPRACEDPDVALCRAELRPFAEALRETLPDDLDADAFAAAFDGALGDAPRLALTRYTFYYDPAHPEAPVDAHLQRVDAPIAEAAARLAPGAISQRVSTRFGHHLLRLERADPAVDLAYSDPRAQALLTAALCPAWLAGQRDRYVADLLAPLAVTVRREVVQAAFPPAPR